MKDYLVFRYHCIMGRIYKSTYDFLKDRNVMEGLRLRLFKRGYVHMMAAKKIFVRFQNV